MVKSSARFRFLVRPSLVMHLQTTAVMSSACGIPSENSRTARWRPSTISRAVS